MKEFDEFVSTIAALRAPDGCPWDKAQTHQSIAHNMIEEAYEAVDAIEADDMVHLREELGDVLLEVVLQAQIAADEGAFTMADVARDVNEKIVRRHPHVFGDAVAQDAGEVQDLWDQVKLAEAAEGQAATGASGEEESGNSSKPQSLLASVPTGFPALMQAQKVSKKAASAGFEWDTLDDVWAKVDEEVKELREAYAAAEKDARGRIVSDPADMIEAGIDAAAEGTTAAEVEMEFGDVLFALVNVARRMGVNSENALRAATRKFRCRWAFIEEEAWRQGRCVRKLSTEEMNELWEQAKAREGR